MAWSLRGLATSTFAPRPASSVCPSSNSTENSEEPCHLIMEAACQGDETLRLARQDWPNGGMTALFIAGATRSSAGSAGAKAIAAFFHDSTGSIVLFSGVIVLALIFEALRVSVNTPQDKSSSLVSNR